MDRVVAFGDAVVAIAITLVVLPLVDRATEARSAGEYFSSGWLDLVSAGLSFAVIAVFWRAHHWLFADALGYTSAVLHLEVLWLASIVFLPVATVLDFTGDGGDPLALGVYIGTMLVGSVALRLERVVLERAGLIREGARLPALELWTGAALLLLALVLAVALPGVGAYWLLLLFLEGPVIALIRRGGRADAGRESGSGASSG
ncbi:TMEM175 family protein [Rothia halotolerans]|uniref:TMEM175 family protein n=1 Tax=Rothia halotolerans TaxID=405770 RepID=UPI001EDD96EA|nr:TMEM175 family protein [Rothia halotolerans]